MSWSIIHRLLQITINAYQQLLATDMSRLMSVHLFYNVCTKYYIMYVVQRQKNVSSVISTLR